MVKQSKAKKPSRTLATRGQVDHLRRRIKSQGDLIDQLRGAFQIQMAINDEAARSTRRLFDRIDDLILAIDNPEKLRKLQDESLGRKLAGAIMDDMIFTAKDRPMSGLAAQVADQDEELHDLEGGPEHVAGDDCEDFCLECEIESGGYDHIDLSHESCEDVEIL